MTNLERALLVAERVHAKETYDIYPYMFHIRQTVLVAQELGFDEDVQVGCALHDVMEEGNLSYNDIKKHFGEQVAEIVFCVTDELGRNRKEKKEKTYPKLKANLKATLVKFCDRISNVRNSKQFNNRLFSMYVEENHDFCLNLANTHPDVQKAFNLLIAEIRL
jgi:guanosine-3',5'-bis(diphosphate) 3'-pyrophosphohydrolase